MKKMLVFKDDKSQKFWRIDYSGENFAVNYGKYGTIGRYEVKEFDSEEESNKTAEKLIAQKLKKGYKEEVDFDYTSCIYIDDDEMGLHSKTSHPNFVEHFTDDLYYDCGHDTAPFGSDTGNDTLRVFLSEDIRKNPKLDFFSFPQNLIEKVWEMTYIPATNVSKEETKSLMENSPMDLEISDMVICATAFGQIKMTGKLDGRLKNLAINALKRRDWAHGGDSSEMTDQMIGDLLSFSNVY